MTRPSVSYRLHAGRWTVTAINPGRRCKFGYRNSGIHSAGLGLVVVSWYRRYATLGSARRWQLERVVRPRTEASA